MATIIKQRDCGTSNGVAFEFANLAMEGTPKLEYDYSDASAVLAAARKEADAIRFHAAQEGRAAGLAEAEKIGDERLAARLETVLPALNKVVEDLGQARHAWRSHWEKQAVHLAAAIARRIVRRELRAQPDITLDLVAEALELAAGQPEIRLLLNPDDYQSLGDQVNRLAAEVGRLSPAQIIADSSVTPGGCRVDTRHGTIDQSIEAQLDRIEQELA